MFNDKILKSVAEAVKQVLATEKLHPNQQKLDVHEPEKDKLTAKDFELLRKGKKAEVKEGWDEMMKAAKERRGPQPSGGSGKKEGSRYGGSKQKEEKPLKEEEAYDKDRYAVKDGKAVKDNPTHMGSANYKDQPHHVWATSAEEALKKKGVKEEASNDEFHAEVKKAQNKSLGKEKAEVSKPAVAAVKQESVEQIEERQMTEPEMKERERIVKGMKKGLEGFKARYGERAKSVIYATATKQAMKD